MSLDRWFRLSSTVTLGLSCSALVFAEDPFLPDLPICLPPVLALLLLAWCINGRWRLPHWVANILGILIAAAGIVWLVRQYTDDESLLARLPLQLAMLPYMGPLLMAALLVKMFGSRVVSDFWTLQGLGLMQMCLGCVLDGGPVFGTLLVLYVASGLTCLALRYRLYSDRREEEVDALRPSRNERSTAPASFSVRWLLPFALRWTLLIAVPALALFLLTPRSDSNAWEPLSSLGSSRTAGGSEEIDLNNTGRIKLDDEIALHVAAVDAAGRPKLDLPEDQRWRGIVLDSYENGKWAPMRLNPMRPRGPGQRELPDFGPQEFFLDYKVAARQSGVLVLADPIRFGPSGARLPVVTYGKGEQPPLFYLVFGSLLPGLMRTEHEYHYRQVVPVGTNSERMPAPGALLQFSGSRLRALPSQLGQTLRSWTVELLEQLSQDGSYDLPQGVLDALAQPHESFTVERRDWEATALILTDYLAHSGEYTYSLELSRSNPTLDPVVDFLCNVKQGHCERYAAALTLMLRSVGIPARIVKGFRGCEHLGEGQYVIRHHHAHAWVEILVPHPGFRGEPLMPPPLMSPRRLRFTPQLGRREAPPRIDIFKEIFYDWLTLDPTPAQDAPPAATAFSFTHFWEDVQRLGRQGWQSLIVGYNADEQADLWDMLRPGRSQAALRKLGLAAPAILAVFCAGLIFSRWRRRRTAASVAAAKSASFYSRLVSILSRYASFHPISGQTPLEYSEAARAFLQTRAALSALAEFPVRVVDRFYQVRFGARSLSGAERQALDAELDRFADVVRQDKPSAQTEQQP